MSEQEIAIFVGKMHIHKITQKALAGQMGVSENYVSEVLRGTKKISSTNTTFSAALDELIKEKTG